MKCFLEWTLQNKSCEIEIHNFEDERYCDLFLSNFGQEIENAGLSSTLIKKSCGFFENVDETKTLLSQEIVQRLEQHFGYEVCFHVTDEERVTISKNFMAVSELIEEIMDDAYGYIITGTLILIMMKNFLLNGKWQIGIREPSGLLTKKNFKREDYEQGKPIIWFGIDDEMPHPCWTISEDPSLEETRLVYTTGGNDPAQIENWKIFWHEIFWTLDWTQLLNGKGDVYTTWMFAECGMEEPIEEFQHIRNSCPIDLNNIGNFGELTSQLRLYFQLLLSRD